MVQGKRMMNSIETNEYNGSLRNKAGLCLMNRPEDPPGLEVPYCLVSYGCPKLSCEEGRLELLPHPQGTLSLGLGK